MELIDILILAVIAGIIGTAVWYIRSEKKKGKKCIGCPDSGSCSGHCTGNCSGCSGSCPSKK